KNKQAVGVEFLKDGVCYQAFARKKIILSAGISSVPILMQSGIGNKKTLHKFNIPVIKDNPNVGKHYADHPAITATFTINPNDHISPPDDPNALYAGGAFLPNPTPGSDKKVRGIQMFAQAGTLSDATDNHVMTIGAILLQPKSRGDATIQNADPLKITLGNQGYLIKDADLNTFMYTYKVYIKQIAEQLAKIDPQYKLM